MSINDIFQDDDYREYTIALHESIETAQELLNEIKENVKKVIV